LKDRRKDHQVSSFIFLESWNFYFLLCKD